MQQLNSNQYKMKNSFYIMIFIGVIYLLSTFVYSYFLGLPPFNHGFVIGFPAMYYQFNVSQNDIQYGFIGKNIFFNMIIILGIYLFVLLCRKVLRCK